MSILLETLYNEISSDHEVVLLTENCFDQSVTWMHMVEIKEFAYLLHGGELIFNSGVNFTSPEWLKSFIDELINAEASGLIIAARNYELFTPEIIDYCNKIHFPLFSASWNTSFLEIMRQLSEILLSVDQASTVLTSALKNAIYFPTDYKSYVPHFERSNYFNNSYYTITIIEVSRSITTGRENLLENFKKSFRFIIKESIILSEQDRLILLTINHRPSHLKETFSKLNISAANLYIGIGSYETGFKNIYSSYKNALTAFQICQNDTSSKITVYDELGIYQLLANTKDPDICFNFMQTILGPLIAYDTENKSNLLEVLECFYDNECNLVQTADALYFHKNTLKYKINKIQEILDCDIRSNQNRLQIMLALKIYQLDRSFFY